MRFRFFSFLLLLMISTSCEYFNLEKKSNLQAVDTIIDFSSVDSPPTFLDCKEFIDKEIKRNCFRTTLHKHISQSLASYNVKIKKSIDTKIVVNISISNKGKIQIHQILSEYETKDLSINLDSIINVSLSSLPRVFPAVKRGIPVSTQYQIPIQIVVK